MEREVTSSCCLELNVINCGRDDRRGNWYSSYCLQLRQVMMSPSVEEMIEEGEIDSCYCLELRLVMI